MHGRGSRGAAPASNSAGRGDAGVTPLTARQATSCHVDSPTRVDATQIGPYQLNIGVFRPEKGNRPIRRKKNFKTENTGGFDTQSSPA